MLRRRPPNGPPKWGLDRWWDDVIPVVLGLIALAACLLIMANFLQAPW